MKKLGALLLSVLMMIGTVLPCVSFTYANEQTAQKETLTCHNIEISASSDQLLYGYLTAQSVRKTKFKLKGDANKALYDILLEHVKDIAAGKKSNTEITVTAAQMGLENKKWTNRDFDISDKQNLLSNIASLIGFDQRNLLYALLANSPYDLYWFNKGKGCYIAGSVLSDGEQVKLASLTFQFYVYSDYQANNDPYTVDSAKLVRVNTAKGNANKIVANYANNSDYTRLKDYKQAICDLVSYNTEAAAESNPAYGDPWQIINVFDGDPNTKVVCEGYAKAFKYLCDLSTFASDNIDCILVSGNMSANGSGGAHMWNVVTMDDGKNYLADVTNCDEGAIGEGDYLFLVGDPLKTGSPADGYTIEFTKPGYNPSSIKYTYDEDTLASYKDDDDQDSSLTLNTSNYVASTNVHTHTYGKPTFTWSSDYSTATAAFTCAKNDETKTVNATVTSNTIQEATEDAEGKIEYTAQVLFNGTEYTESKEKTTARLEKKDQSADTSASSHKSGDTTNGQSSTVTGSPVINNSTGTSEGTHPSGHATSEQSHSSESATDHLTGPGSAAETVITGTGKKAVNKKKAVKLSQVKIKSVKNKSGKKVKIVFKKVKKAKKYQISYRLAGKKKWMTKTVSKTTYVLKNLKKKRMYSIRIRAVNGKSYGKWSRTKTIFIRK